MRQAIEGARALVPLLEQRHAEQLGPIRDTLSQLQMVYAQQAGGQAAAPASEPGAEPAEEQPEAGGSRARPELRSALDSGAVIAAFRLNAR